MHKVEWWERKGKYLVHTTRLQGRWKKKWLEQTREWETESNVDNAQGGVMRKKRKILSTRNKTPRKVKKEMIRTDIWMGNWVKCRQCTRWSDEITNEFEQHWEKKVRDKKTRRKCVRAHAQKRANVLGGGERVRRQFVQFVAMLLSSSDGEN